jgi:regulator of protease activity HflC (stomatin/prohibitin superfamily)
MRIAFLITTLFFGISVGTQAIATVNEYQESQAEKFCQIDPNYCK